MIAALVASVALLWIVVVILAGVVYALTRQLGVLYERVAPAGALTIGRGVAAGEPAPVVRAQTLGGETEMVGVPSVDGRATLVFFLSPSCPVCKALLPALRTMADAESAELRILLAGDGDAGEHEALVRNERLERFAFVLSTQLAMTWQISKLPYAVLFDAAGIVRSHGIVNSLEHLESLVEARERGVASIQEYVRQQNPSAAEHAAHTHDDVAEPAHGSETMAQSRAKVA